MTAPLPDPSQATQLLQRMSGGDEQAANELLPILYEELRNVAERFMSRERNDHTLQPTALVHEAYLKLVDEPHQPEWENRAHFVRFAARAMRNVLVDHARAKKTAKRGEGLRKVPLDEVLAAFEERSLDVLALDEALEVLFAMDEQLARVVELRYFAGLTIAETAQVLGVSTPTVERAWRVARLWLLKRVG